MINDHYICQILAGYPANESGYWIPKSPVPVRITSVEEKQDINGEENQDLKNGDGGRILSCNLGRVQPKVDI